MVVTGDGELGFDSGEGARETATTSKEGSRRANYPIPTRGGIVAVKKLVVGPWVGSTGPPAVCTGRLVPSTGDTLLALIGRGRASGAVTLKKLECSKQAYAPDTLAWDNIIGFRSYSLAFGIGTNNCESICQGCFH
ncbi:unnamed protein product [Prunus brigantina]